MLILSSMYRQLASYIHNEGEDTSIDLQVLDGKKNKSYISVTSKNDIPLFTNPYSQRIEALNQIQKSSNDVLVGSLFYDVKEKVVLNGATAMFTKPSTVQRTDTKEVPSSENRINLVMTFGVVAVTVALCVMIVFHIKKKSEAHQDDYNVSWE